MSCALFSVFDGPGGTGCNVKHNKKLKALKKKQKVTYTTNQKFYPQTHNNTNVHYSHNEIELQNKGLKHNTNNKN